MVDIIKKASLLLMSEQCFDNYFQDFNFFDVGCGKALISKGLGLGIIAGSVLVKIPQILKILNAKSSEGISIYSVLLDLLAITFHISYSFVKGFPFSAWGDGTFLALQTAAIASLIYFYGHKSALRALIFIGIYSLLTYVLMSGITPLEYLWTAQGFNIPILLVGKLSQAWTNYRNGSTGQLSAATCFMLLAGSLARIFTSVQETGDSMMVIIYIVSSFANGVIVSQLLYYWNKPCGPSIVAKDKPAEKQKPKKAKKDD
ncbi:mannose-P-dolichol utilization defect 1 protein homolog [Chironomus tepperi]|uniref:mannose-P-dolichol utilization defect 1 protein homolog n=1 Tax=Chironomus tepperi TaxID=113505 RepID=UPI00391F9E2E